MNKVKYMCTRSYFIIHCYNVNKSELSQLLLIIWEDSKFVSLSVLDPSATDTSVAKEGEEKSEESPKEETKPEEGEETKEVKGRRAWL